MKVKKVDLSKLSPEQREAFLQMYRDCQTFAPHRDELLSTAQKVFQEFVKAPEWRVCEAPHPQPPQENLWRVGAPEVNYVDKIERDL